MTLSAVEVHAGSIAAGGNVAVSITTTLQPTDRVVVMGIAPDGASGTPSVSGLGATWTNHIAATTTLARYLWSATGVTGTGTVTVTAGFVPFSYCVWVIRGGAQVSHDASTTGIQASAPSGTAVQTPDITAAAGMLVLAGAGTTGGTMTFPHANTLPSGGWTTDYAATRSGFISQVLSSGGTLRAAASTNTFAHLGAIAAAFVEDAGVPALTAQALGASNPIF